jgi:hypothetical protein
MNYMTETTRQEVLSFAVEGRVSSAGEALQQVTNKLNERLAEMRRPVIVSVSHSSGYTGHSGHYATLVAIVNVPH